MNEPLGPFLEELERRLAKLTREQLLDALRIRARALAPDERLSFLTIFSPYINTSAEVVELVEDEDEELLADIDAFIKALSDGDYVDYSGYDRDFGDDRCWGDESWADEMDDLFEQANRQFLAGHHSIAAKAFERLLNAFAMQEEGEHFCGPAYPESMVKTNLDEAGVRYLRAVYESTPAGRRAAALADAYRDVYTLGDSTPNIQSLGEADSEPLPDLESFWPRWIKALDARKRDGHVHGWEKARRMLLREAMERSQGLMGLEALARSQGAKHPEAYQDWVEALLRQGDKDAAIAAAQEGIRHIEDGEARARLADRLVELAPAEQQSELALEACHEAWHAAPTLRRLLDLCAAGQPSDEELESRLSLELDALQSGESKIPAPLAARLAFLAGDYESPLEALAKSEDRGWGTRRELEDVVLAFLLRAGCGFEEFPEQSSLARLWQIMDQESLGYAYTSVGATGPGNDAPSYSALLNAALKRHPPSPEQALGLLEAAEALVKKRAQTIVKGQLRTQYGDVACCLVATAEAYHLAGQAARGQALIEAMHKAFPRHNAFRSELKKLCEATPFEMSSKPAAKAKSGKRRLRRKR